MTAATSQLIAVLGRGVVDPDEPAVAGDDLGLTRGDGCFDAMRLVVGDAMSDGAARIDFLDGHLARFARSAAPLGIPCDVDAWRLLIDEACAAWREPGEAVLRVMLTRGRESSPGGPPTGVLTINPIDERAIAARRGIDVVTLSRGHPARAFADAPWLLGGVKTLSYAVNLAAGREATRRGAGDALFVSTDGYALEAPRSSLVWASGDRLRSSSLDGTGILASVTQQGAFEAAEGEGVDAGYALIPTAELFDVEAMWLVSAIRGPVPVLSLDGRPVRQSSSWHDRLLRWCRF